MGGFVMTKTFSKLGDYLNNIIPRIYFKLLELKSYFIHNGYNIFGVVEVSFTYLRYNKNMDNKRRDFHKVGGLSGFAAITGLFSAIKVENIKSSESHRTMTFNMSGYVVPA
tara:strand:- start:1238 stop:1570 length:333 start_codon:yes stop_codon:yes gene_type:complete